MDCFTLITGYERARSAPASQGRRTGALILLETGTVYASRICLNCLVTLPGWDAPLRSARTAWTAGVSQTSVGSRVSNSAITFCVSGANGFEKAKKLEEISARPEVTRGGWQSVLGTSGPDLCLGTKGRWPNSGHRMS